MSRGHLLIVDDEITILQTLKKLLSLEGYSVDVAGGYGIAREKFERNNYDLALIDVALRDGDGVELLGRLRENKNDVPVLMMSGHATVDGAVRATKLGASDFLEKPLSSDRLLIVIENTLRLVRAEAQASSLLRQAGVGGALIGDGAKMASLREQITRAAKSNATVLVLGERGTGKELVARAIHAESRRRAGPLEKLNCAAVPSELIESELFGHEAGAFSGATKQRRGKFERASLGTLFLDEVGDMPLAMQSKLLRVLQEQEIERVGGSETFKIDVRVVAATNKDLETACETGTFRHDLFDRLNVLRLTLPPLRARREDVPQLARHFLAILGAANDRPELELTDAGIARLVGHSFPGNVRELRNLIERLVILTPDAHIDGADVETFLGATTSAKTAGLFRAGVPFRVLSEEAERTILEEAIRHHSGHMAQTARGLDLERSHLYKKCKSLGLRDADPAPDPT
ncbi:MAG: sigma-54-dependent Fis family transcriptional regulator [Myxococcales bacterium]|nr:sigma-54-dependent Fis family transcriptional regulator [Myxococcales bacterium]